MKKYDAGMIETASTHRCCIQDAIHQAGQGVASGSGAIRRAALPTH